MAKKMTSRTHVFPSAFDALCAPLGPDKKANNELSKMLCRDERTIRDWRSGLRPCPRWAFELTRLTIDERKRLVEEMTGRYRKNRKAFEWALTRLSLSLGVQYGLASANDNFHIIAIDVPSNEEGSSSSAGA